MNVFRLGLIPIFVMSLIAGMAPPVSAQDAPAASFPARIVQGTCDDLDQEAVFQLADVTYGEGAEEGAAGVPAATPGAAELLGPQETILVATGVTEIDTTVQQLVDPPHAVAVFESREAEAQNAVACGPIGGVFTGQNLFFGLQELNESGYVGVGWITTMEGEQVTLTIFLSSLPTATEPEPVPAAGEIGTPEGDAAAETTPAAATEAASPATAEGSPAADGEAAAETITIESVDIDFNPAEATIPANTDVTIMLPNNGAILHNFSITEKNNPDLPIEPIDIDIQPGETEEVVVNLPPGDYYYFCDVPGHEAAGMFGTLHVEA